MIGGHGHVAKHFTQLATSQGHQVDSVIRRDDQAHDVTSWRGNPVVADVTTLRPAQWDDLINSHDAVVWSAGAGGKGTPEDTYACLLYTSPSPRDLSTSRMPSSA